MALALLLLGAALAFSTMFTGSAISDPIDIPEEPETRSATRRLYPLPHRS